MKKGSRKNELVSRWSTEGGQVKRKKVLDLIRKGDLAVLAREAGEVDGRIDLRGLPFEGRKEELRKIDTGKFMITVGAWEGFHNVTLEWADLSFSNMKRSYWTDCIIRDCLFNETQMMDARFWGCTIEDCTFTECVIKESVLDAPSEKNYGCWKGVIFSGGGIDNSHFNCPRMEGCVFGCDINKTDFGRARLIGCTFTGRLKDVEFRGGQSPPYKIGNQLVCKSGGILDKVDFSKAHFDGVDFRDGIDLSDCSFPLDQVTLISDVITTLTNAIDIIKKEWNGKEKEGILWSLNYIIEDAKKSGQRHYIIEWSIYDRRNGNVGARYREVIKRALETKKH